MATPDLDGIINRVASAWSRVLDTLPGPASPAPAVGAVVEPPSPWLSTLDWARPPSFGSPIGGGVATSPYDTPAGPSGLGGYRLPDVTRADPYAGVMDSPGFAKVLWDKREAGGGAYDVTRTAPPRVATTPSATGGKVTLSQPVADSGGYAVSNSVTPWTGLAEEMSAKYGVPVEIILASIDSESGGNPNAVGPSIPGVGNAYGLLQAVDKYWGQYGNLRDPRTNLDIVVGKLMAPAWRKYGSAAHVRAVTYGGPGAIDANGNIIADLADTAPAMGGWTIGQDIRRYLPKVEAYRQWYASRQQPAATNSGGQWGHIVPGGTGRVELGGTHGGKPAVDIFAAAGTPIYAPADGVSSPGTYSLGGNATTIQGADGRWYYFAHAQAPMMGGSVRKGQIIGYVGNSGNARGTAPHLHYAVASRPEYINMWNGSGDITPD